MMILEGKCMKTNQKIITWNRRRQNTFCQVFAGIIMKVAEAREIEMLLKRGRFS